MFGDENSQKDSSKTQKDNAYSIPAPYQAGGFGSGAYNKTDKLIIALYMVTDIIPQEEPLRSKLRTLGLGILSDINTTPPAALGKIREAVSFLKLGKTMNIVSSMNADILLKEFSVLDQAIKDSAGSAGVHNQSIDLEEFLKDDEAPILPQAPTRLGVQKGSTLLKALSDKKLLRPTSSKQGHHTPEVSKGQRRQDILNIIKILGGSATIKDIKDKASTLPDKGHFLNSLSEKTLQRELVSMVHDGVLNKSGEKRWSRYSVARS